MVIKILLQAAQIGLHKPTNRDQLNSAPVLPADSLVLKRDIAVDSPDEILGDSQVGGLIRTVTLFVEPRVDAFKERFDVVVRGEFTHQRPRTGV
jgi:hypothetical protein